MSCRPRIWCVSDDSELSAASFGLTKRYEKHFGVVEQEISMISGDFFLRFFGEIRGCIFEKSKKSRKHRDHCFWSFQEMKESLGSDVGVDMVRSTLTPESLGQITYRPFGSILGSEKMCTLGNVFEL